MDRFYMLVVRGLTKKFNVVKDRATGECVQMPLNLTKAQAVKHAKKLNAEHTEAWMPKRGVLLSERWGSRPSAACIAAYGHKAVAA